MLLYCCFTDCDGVERFQARDPFEKKPKIKQLERERRFQRAHTVDVRGAEDDGMSSMLLTKPLR
jgi:hypothetical protein